MRRAVVASSQKTISVRRSLSSVRRATRRYHLVDSDAHTFESAENPDWLVGAY